MAVARTTVPISGIMAKFVVGQLNLFEIRDRAQTATITK